MRKKEKGFSLIELLIVVAIILIIAAIAIPNLMRSKMAANEASAISSMRSINTAQVAYNATYPDMGYSTALTVLGPPSGSASCVNNNDATSANACLLDNVLSSGTKAGYYFKIASSSSTPNPTYQSYADPITAGASGQRHFYSDATGVIRQNQSAAAASADTPIQ